MDLDTLQLEAEESMEKAVSYLQGELKGIRTGRASTGLVEYVKVEVYGAQTDLRSVALISTPEPAQILVKPFDPGTAKDIARGIENAGLGLNPQTEGKQIRMNIPPLSGERRKELVNSCKQMGEQAKVTVRNARRDANKHIDQLEKDKSSHLSEDEVSDAKEQIQDLTKQYETKIGQAVSAKTEEVTEV